MESNIKHIHLRYFRLSSRLDAICGLLGYYVAYIGNSLPKFRYNLSFPYSRVKKSKILRPVWE